MRKFYVTYVLGNTCQEGKPIHAEEVWLEPSEKACVATFKRHLFGASNANHTIIAWSLTGE